MLPLLLLFLFVAFGFCWGEGEEEKDLAMANWEEMELAEEEDAFGEEEGEDAWEPICLERERDWEWFWGWEWVQIEVVAVVVLGRVVVCGGWRLWEESFLEREAEAEAEEAAADEETETEAGTERGLEMPEYASQDGKGAGEWWEDKGWDGEGAGEDSALSSESSERRRGVVGERSLGSLADWRRGVVLEIAVIHS
jgi:hypothetical protein